MVRALETAVLSVVTVALVTAVGLLLGADALTVMSLLLVAVLGLAAWRGIGGGVLTSVLGTAALNYCFLPPVGTFHLADRQNWFALAGFLVASIVTSRLVARARERAEEAERRAREVESLLRERTRLESVQASDALKTALLRAVSHDLSTPLVAMGLAVEALNRTVPREGETAQALDVITQETSRLHRRIENLLAMARLEAGRATLHREPLPPADLFRAAREHLHVLLASRPVETHVAADCPDLDADPSLALEIMVNLIENAHRVAPQGSPIVLQAMPAPGDPRRAWLEILDRGPGPSHAAHGGGAGLGLLIAASFAAAHGGSASLLERDGGGARARVELPAVETTP